MAEYPTLPPFSGSTEQSNIPFLPPFQNQLIQFSNNPYAINHAALYGSTSINPGAAQMTMYQGLNQDLASLPQYNNSLHEPTYLVNENCEQHINSQICESNLGQIYSTNLQTSVPFNQSSKVIPNHQKQLSVALKTKNPYSGITGTKAPNHLQNNNVISYNKQEVSKLQQAPNNGAKTISEQAILPEAQRQKSSSYSPQISPDAPEKSPHIRSPPKSSTKDGQHSRIQPRHNFQNLPKKPQTNGDQSVYTSALPKSMQALVHTSGDQPTRKNRTSLFEIKNKAQDAILSLSSHGIQYQTFIREGFKEDVVGKLFEELDISRSSGNRTGTTECGKLSGSSASQLGEVNIEESNTMQSANKPVLPIPSDRNSSLAPKKPSQMDEKQKTLQSKMEALRKSREARATAKTLTKIDQEPIPTEQQQQEPASTTHENISTHQPSPVTSPKPCPIVQSPEKNPSAMDSLPQAPSLPIHEPIVQKIRNQEAKKASSELTIPGLFLASNRTSLSTTPPLHSPVNQRKRPVASDFDDSHILGSFKRPFGHNRNEQRFVIDVSDDESEDGDVPMDIESQVDYLSPVCVPEKVNSVPSTTGLPTIPQKPFTPPPNSSVQTPSAMSNVPLSTPSILLQKQREIQLMKKKIAEAEAQLRAKSTPACAGSPQRSESVASDAKNTPSPAIISNKNIDSTRPTRETLEEPSSEPTISNQLASEENNVPVSTQDISEDKRLRRKIIVANIPLVEAEVEQRQSKLEQLRAEMNIIEAGLKEHLEEKKRLAEEMDRLGHEPEESPQAHSEIIVSEAELSDNQTDGTPAALEPEQPETNPLKPILPQNDNSNISDEEPGIIVTAASSDISSHDCLIESQKEEVRVPGTEVDLDPTEHKPNLESTLTETVQSEVNVENDPSSVASDPVVTLDVLRPVPEAANLHAEIKTLNPDNSVHPASNEVLEGESDNYEPPEAAATIAKSPKSSPFSPAPPGFIHETKIDSEPNVDTKQVLEESKQILRTEAQLEEDAGAPQPLVHDPFIPLQSARIFTPYKSPLRVFRAYRFHPNFKKEVHGGLRSLTYSHRIDANKEFCRFEVAGGVCNDTTCDLQHFKSIILPDDGVMAALGSPEEFKGDRREQFVAGLREVLLGLRLRQVKDFDMIASEIVAHRAKFLGDNSKILALEGITV